MAGRKRLAAFPELSVGICHIRALPIESQFHGFRIETGKSYGCQAGETEFASGAAVGGAPAEISEGRQAYLGIKQNGRRSIGV